MAFAYVKCPDCGRTWSTDLLPGQRGNEQQCPDCLMMPGWQKDFDSPPHPREFALFKKFGEKLPYPLHYHRG